MAGGRQLRSRRQSHAGQRGNRLWGLPAPLGSRRPAPPRPRVTRPRPPPPRPALAAARRAGRRGRAPCPERGGGPGKGPALGPDAPPGLRSAVPGLAAWRQRAALRRPRPAGPVRPHQPERGYIPSQGKAPQPSCGVIAGTRCAEPMLVPAQAAEPLWKQLPEGLVARGPRRLACPSAGCGGAATPAALPAAGAGARPGPAGRC